MRIDRSISPCPQCHRADDVRPPTLNPDGDLEFVCSDRHAGMGPVVFLRLAQPDPSASSVPAAERGAVRILEPLKTDDLLEPMRACIQESDGWVEHGVLELRLRQHAPEIFARHVAEAGHIMFGPKRNTASGVRFAMALRRLAAAGQLESDVRRSTGEAWKQSTMIGFWRAVPEGVDAIANLASTTLTWADHCAAAGRSDDWTNADRAGLSSPSQRDADSGSSGGTSEE